MSRIQQLSTSVINKIAAGEVIERPASVVKELLENSVDALATRIDVDIIAGGSELIRIVDDGEGIHPDDLLLSVSSHATSKIRNADDLFGVVVAHGQRLLGQNAANVIVVHDDIAHHGKLLIGRHADIHHLNLFVVQQFAVIDV